MVFSSKRLGPARNASRNYGRQWILRRLAASGFDAPVQWTHSGSSGTVHATLRLDNLFDRRYVGTVIVNETNARYYEPSAGRTVLAMLSLDWR